MSELFPKTLTVKQAVLATLAYFDLFGIPLNRQEISEHLLFVEPDEPKIDIYLKESPLIHMNDGYFSIKGDELFYREFEEKKKRSKKYWKTVRRYQWLFSVIPFVELVCVCNSLPIRDVDIRSDIDLLIVTKKDKLFTARFFTTLFVSLLGKRRHGIKTKKRFCLSFYVTEEVLDFNQISLKPYDIYLAYWLRTLEPITGDYKQYERILSENEKFLKPYFKNRLTHKRRFRKTKTKAEIWKNRFENAFQSQKWEDYFKKHQLKRALVKKDRLPDSSGTIINERMLKFHDNDKRHDLFNKWYKHVKEII